MLNVSMHDCFMWLLTYADHQLLRNIVEQLLHIISPTDCTFAYI